MKNTFLSSMFIKTMSNISTAKLLYLIISVFLTLIIILVLLIQIQMSALISIRAYVGAEGLWAKAQKDAVSSLQNYAASHNEEDYKAYLSFIQVPLGDLKARIEMQKPNPNLDIARKGFIEGGNHPEDAEYMISLFLRFQHAPFMAQAIKHWTLGDQFIAELNGEAERLHEAVISGRNDPDLTQALLVRLNAINKNATEQENLFSATLAETSRWASKLASTLTYALAVIFSFLGMAVSWPIMKRIRTTETALLNSEHNYDQLVRKIPGGTYVFKFSPVGAMNFEYVSPRFCEMLNLEAEVLLQDPNQGFARAHPEDFESLMQAIDFARTSLQPFRWEGRLTVHDETRWFGISSDPTSLPDGSSLWHGMMSDISERKQAQDEILRLNASLEERVRQRTAELEEKAAQLTLTSQYKSEFLSNMSHELRTPLNSLLLLSQLLTENDERNLSGKQIEYAKAINGAGKDLLVLINDILDLSKIESGVVTLELDDETFANVGEQLERTFRHVAQSRGLGFCVEPAPGLPRSLYTDAQRLQQVLKNLLSNAFKFTQKGQVSVRIAAVESGWSVDHAGLNRAGTVIGFFVTDSGIGLAADKQKIIFEAFQQADTGTARRYGGTGLGLSISRELARLLGGELRLAMSELGQGSTFVLYLPLRAPEPRQGLLEGLLGSEPPNSPNPQPFAALDDRAAIKPEERR